MTLSVLLALLVGSAGAARSPDPERAARLVSELSAAALEGSLTPEQLDGWLVPPALDPMPEERRAAWYQTMTARLAPGGDLGGQLGGGIAGVIQGPGYARVVLRGPPWLTFVVVRGPAGPVIERIERSGCGLCQEPERFVVDLLRDLADPERAPGRLLAGLDLYLGEAEGVDLGALDRRNIHAGYLRWLLRDARVRGASGERVSVSLERGVDGEPLEEDWTITWLEDHWALDYSALPEDSPLRLEPAEGARWRDPEVVAEATAAWWLPTWSGYSPRLVASDILYAAPRPRRGELVLYTQDLGRSAAVLVRLDAETGEVLATSSLPRLSARLQVAPYQWRSLFRVALSPDGEALAIAAHSALWVVAVETGEVLYTGHELSRAGALAWSRDGAWLAACDGGGALRLLERDSRYATRASAGIGAACTGLAWRGDALLTAVNARGELHSFEAPALSPAGPVGVACCGTAAGASAAPGSGELLVSCADTCAPIWLWRDPPPWEGDPPEGLADERMAASPGAVSPEPSGRWLVAPWAGEGGAAALLEAGTGEVLATFAERPLVQVAWDIEADMLYGVDTAGDLWQWSVTRLRTPRPSSD